MSLTLSVRLSVTLLLQIDSSFLFIDGIEPFGRHLSMWHSTKNCSSIFDSDPLTPKIFSRKFAIAQNRLKSACMTDRPEMFGPTRGFSGMADSMEPCKMLWADPCCHGNDIWPRRGDLVAYRLVLPVFSGEPLDC